MWWIPLVITLILSLIFYYTEEYFDKVNKYNVAIISFSSGLFITYIFLSMFPELFLGIRYLDYNVFFIALWGFIILHVAEKHVFQHSDSEDSLLKEITAIRVIGFFITHFILGFALVLFFQQTSSVNAYLSLIPLAFHMISSGLLLHAFHHKMHWSKVGRVISASAITVGAIVSSFLTLPVGAYYGLFSFITGTFLYLIIRDTMPKYRKGKPVYFLLGVIVYLLILGVNQVFLT